MKNDKIVTINGRKYDSASGRPLADAAVGLAHKSQIIYKKTVQGPINQGVMLARKVGRTMDVARSKSVSHFSPKVVPSHTPTQQKDRPDIGPDRHPLISKVESIRSAAKNNQATKRPVKTAQEQKNEAIAAAMQRADSGSQEPTKKHFNKRPILYVVSFIVILAIGYLVYLFMPSFSVRIASAQAGINATYPEYCPDGYRLSGPVTYSDNEVTINFHANTGNTHFSIKQSKSSWDSSAVKAKAEEDSGDKLLTTNERGLTIFTYNNNATWVNGGILYTITGDAPLSGDQIRRIATSL